MYVCDGSMISANPGVNPSLSITAIAERAMSKIPNK
jgi:cholesterol oxidase